MVTPKMTGKFSIGERVCTHRLPSELLDLEYTNNLVGTIIDIGMYYRVRLDGVHETLFEEIELRKYIPTDIMEYLKSMLLEQD